ncbi:MAG: glycosyltransferase [Bacteroidota bacterium]
MGQVPRLIGVIRKESIELRQYQQQYHFQAIISDNRYGLALKTVKTAFICHQIAPLPWPNWRPLHWLVFQLHKVWLRRFDQLWVPDFEAQPTLSGLLSHRFGWSNKMRFLGPLSRFAGAPDRSVRRSRDLPTEAPEILIILSGPEPQRSHFEQKILAQTKGRKERIWLVQGKPEQENYEICNDCHLISFLDAEDLHWAMTEARVVISRSGYSSLMDYAVLGLKQLILIPTPGQTEQEYLARRLDRQKIALYHRQSRLDLSLALAEVRRYEGFAKISVDPAPLQAAIASLLG